MDDRSSGCIGLVRLSPPLFIESAELVANIVIYRCVYAENEDENEVSRNPPKSESIPKRSNGKITIGPFCYICVLIVYEGQGCHNDWENDPKSICVVAVGVEAPLAFGMPWFEDIKSSMNGDHEHRKILELLVGFHKSVFVPYLMLQFPKR